MPGLASSFMVPELRFGCAISESQTFHTGNHNESRSFKFSARKYQEFQKRFSRGTVAVISSACFIRER